ncbi:MAG: sulfite exporter TauE/SafE family protein [Thermoprotei archaeon]
MLVPVNDIVFFFGAFLVSLVSGVLGSLTGLGGATFLVPIYTLFFSVPLIYASGASLISTIATASGSASGYVKHRIANVKIGVGLTVATTTGSILGSLTLVYVYSLNLEHVIYIVFGIVLLSQVYIQFKRSALELPPRVDPDWTTRVFQLQGKYYDVALNREVEYYGVRWHLGAGIMLVAGFISGLLGIGSGALKVLALDWAMNLPMKVSTTSSNFMIGITAATGSSVYWVEGYIQPVLAAATALGVLAGSFLGARILLRVRNKTVRHVFTLVLLVLGIQMILKGLGYAV